MVSSVTLYLHISSATAAADGQLKSSSGLWTIFAIFVLRAITTRKTHVDEQQVSLQRQWHYIVQ